MTVGRSGHSRNRESIHPPVANAKERDEEAGASLDLVEENLRSLGESLAEKEQFIPGGHGDFGMHVF